MVVSRLLVRELPTSVSGMLVQAGAEWVIVLSPRLDGPAAAELVTALLGRLHTWDTADLLAQVGRLTG